jgi:hypothetical protein
MRNLRQVEIMEFLEVLNGCDRLILNIPNEKVSCLTAVTGQSGSNTGELILRLRFIQAFKQEGEDSN